MGWHLQLLAHPDDGPARAVTFASEDEAISFSRYAAGTVEDLKSSFLHELGEPLLPLDPTPAAEKPRG